jgi:MFS family permease
MIGQAICNGPLLFTTFGIFLIPMTAELGWSRTQFAMDFALASFTTAAVLPFVGLLLDRIGPRKVVLLAVFLLPASYACYGLVHSYAAFLAVAAVAGVLGALSATPSYLAILPGWFDKRLGLALGLAASGTGLGAMVLPLINNAFIASFGWRDAFFFTAAWVAVVGFASAYFLMHENKGAVPESERLPASEHESAQSGETFGAAIRSGAFWSLSAAFALVIFVTLGVNFHLTALLHDRGYSALEGAAAVSALGTAAFAARLFTGFLVDYVAVRVLTTIFFGGQAIAALLLITGFNGAAPYIAAVLLGAAQGSEGDLLPYAMARRFGRKAYGAIYGTAFALYNFGQLLGPPLLGMSYDHFGSYTPMLMILPALSLLAAALVIFTRIPRPC